jgi:hypothetical protein
MVLLRAKIPSQEDEERKDGPFQGDRKEEGTRMAILICYIRISEGTCEGHVMQSISHNNMSHLQFSNYNWYFI